MVDNTLSGLGMDLGNDLSALLSNNEGYQSNGKAIELDINLISEDPDQPRTADNPGFSEQSIAEFSEAIALRGVKSPISVRNDPNNQGRYLINHGARRYRASLKAGKSTIPGFIDNDYNHADQVVENLQRNELTPREIADFIGRELAAGKTKLEIAKSISKSPAFISQYVTLLNLPDVIADLFSSGRCNDVTVINELVKAHKSDPDAVVSLIDTDSEITRGIVKDLRGFIANNASGESIDIDEHIGEENVKHERKNVGKTEDPNKLKKTIVVISYQGNHGRLILNKRPSQKGMAWIKLDDGFEFEVELKDVLIIEILEG